MLSLGFVISVDGLVSGFGSIVSKYLRGPMRDVLKILPSVASAGCIGPPAA